MKKIIAMLIVGIFLLAGFSTVGVSALNICNIKTQNENKNASIDNNLKWSFYINCDEDFKKPSEESGVVGGSGTLGDPYMIEGWLAVTEISIKDTISHFIINNCNIFFNGIHLENVSNGKIKDCVFHYESSVAVGIGIVSSNSIMVEGCKFYSGQQAFGVEIESSENIEINDCIFNGGVLGIGIALVSKEQERNINNEIHDCKINGYQTGIYLVNSDDNEIHHCTLKNNIMNIQIGNSLAPDINNNIIHHNNFLDIVPVGGFSAYSYGNNQWNDEFGEGNYWEDYTGTDEDGDGIGETPYVISKNNQDNFPLMQSIGKSKTKDLTQMRFAYLLFKIFNLFPIIQQFLTL